MAFPHVDVVRSAHIQVQYPGCNKSIRLAHCFTQVPTRQQGQTHPEPDDITWPVQRTFEAIEFKTAILPLLGKGNTFVSKVTCAWINFEISQWLSRTLGAQVRAQPRGCTYKPHVTSTAHHLKLPPPSTKHHTNHLPSTPQPLRSQCHIFGTQVNRSAHSRAPRVSLP